MSWRKITFIIVSLVVLLGGSFALSELFVSLKPEPPRRPESDAKRYVKAEEVKYVDIVSPLSREGRVASSNEVVLVSEAAGKIEAGQVTLKKGASFKKGQLIARIYNCLLYTSDAADEEDSVDLGGRRIIKKKKIRTRKKYKIRK